ncbi:MAG: hypothetical protein SH847_03620 [Roseiflexaceae bacterium]|nr:hypothetical protein [Roseiflexaceae bacterium]
MRNPRSWTSLLGWAIFGLVLAGGPILNLLQSVTGIQFPSFTLPVIIALLMLVSAISSVGRVARGDQRNVPPLPPAVDGANLPRFGPSPSRMPPPVALAPPTMPFPADTIPPLMDRPNELNAPRFEPVINLPLILLGIVGLIVLGLVGVVLFANP